MWWLPGPSGDKEVSGQLGSLEADPPPRAASLLHGSMACLQGDAPGASGVWLWPGTLMARLLPPAALRCPALHRPGTSAGRLAAQPCLGWTCRDEGALVWACARLGSCWDAGAEERVVTRYCAGDPLTTREDTFERSRSSLRFLSLSQLRLPSASASLSVSLPPSLSFPLVQGFPRSSLHTLLQVAFLNLCYSHVCSTAVRGPLSPAEVRSAGHGYVCKVGGAETQPRELHKEVLHVLSFREVPWVPPQVRSGEPEVSEGLETCSFFCA